MNEMYELDKIRRAVVENLFDGHEKGDAEQGGTDGLQLNRYSGFKN
jgi:hypothetical protein